MEQTLARHPGISEVAVVGTSDDRLGEVLLAYVTRRAGDTTAEPEIISWCRERLADFKVPRYVRFRDSLPRNASGKMLKDVLRGDSSSSPR
jgi:acyl-CoA synthetase (AMP-forming)/AMP-acid ligase II